MVSTPSCTQGVHSIWPMRLRKRLGTRCLGGSFIYRRSCSHHSSLSIQHINIIFSHRQGNPFHDCVYILYFMLIFMSMYSLLNESLFNQKAQTKACRVNDPGETSPSLSPQGPLTLRLELWGCSHSICFSLVEKYV